MSPVARFNPAIRSQFLGTFEARQGSSPFLIELTKIDSESDLPDLLKRIITVLRLQFGYPKEDAYDIAVAISEVVQNTFEHNRGPETFGSLAMQV